MGRLVRTIVLEPGQTVVDVSDLEPGTNYDISVRNERDGVLSDPVVIPLTTQAQAPPPPELQIVSLWGINRTAQRPSFNLSIEMRLPTLRGRWSDDYTVSNYLGTLNELTDNFANHNITGFTYEVTRDGTVLATTNGVIRENPSPGQFSPRRGYISFNQFNVRAGEVYTFRANFTSAGGNSEWSDTLEFTAPTTLPTALPGPIRNLAVSDITDTSAVFTWDAPSGINATNRPLRYLFYINQRPGVTQNVPAGTTIHTIQQVLISLLISDSIPTSLRFQAVDLTSEAQYQIQVATQINQGRYVNPVSANFTMKEPPVQAPVSVIAEAVTHTTVTCEWIKSTQGGTARSYLAELSSDEAFPSGTETIQVTVNESTESTFQTTFRGLSVATQYYMRVTTRNADGSATSDVVPVETLPQPTLLPAPPTNLRPTATTYNSMSFTFAASPVSTEHSAAEDYTWQVSTSQAFTTDTTVEDTITDLTALSFTVSDLLPNRYYFIRVRANNEAGAGGYVTNTNTTRAIPVPARVSPKPTASDITPNEATLTWTKPTGIITGYTLTLTGEEQPLTYGVLGEDTLEYTIPGMTAETDYSVTVAAYNGTGAGQASPAEAFTTLEDIAPVMSIADSTTTSIDFEWTTGTLFGDSWTFEYKLATATEWIIAAQEIEGEAYTLEDLTEFTQYNARVKNNAGDLYSSATAVFTTASSITPPALAHAGNGNSANTAVLSLTGGSLTSGDYYWRYRIRGAQGYPATWTTVSLATNQYSFTTTEWAAGQQVQVEGRRGTAGPWSNRLEMVSFNPFLAISNIAATSVDLRATGGDPAESTIHYELLTPPSTWTSIASQQAVQTITHSGLTPDTDYSFRARRGTATSLVVTIRTLAADAVIPGAPTALAMRNLDNLTGTLTWTKGTGVVTSYTIQISTQQDFSDPLRIVEFTVADGDATTYRLPDNTLLTHTTNYLRLIANNAVGSSTPATFTIPTPQPASAVGPNLRTTGMATIIQARFDGGDPSTDALILEWTPALSRTQPLHTIVYSNSIRLAATATMHNITGLNRASRYWVSIRREFGPATVQYVSTL